MAVNVEPEGGRAKKSLSADLNLVPYIDLLTCMIAFLLITAVWTQLAGIKVDQQAAGKDGTDPDVPTTRITVFVHQAGFAVAVNDEQRVLPTITTGSATGSATGPGAQLDFARLGDEMEKLKLSHPDKTDVKVASADDVQFETIVRTMDTVRGAGFPELALVEAGTGL
jgi:biopolymer transport protein TolR